MTVVFPLGLAPRAKPLPAIRRGRTYRAKIELFANDAQTAPFDLTNWITTLTAEAALALAEGTGLTVTPASGFVLIELTAAQTKALTVGELHYVLTILSRENAETFDPLIGTIPVEDP